MLARALAFSSSSCCALIYCSKKFVASFFPTWATIGLAAEAGVGLAAGAGVGLAARAGFGLAAGVVLAAGVGVRLEDGAVTGACFATGGSIFVIGLTVVAGFGGIGFGAGAVVKAVYYCYCSNGF